MGLIKSALTVCLLVAASVAAQASERTKSCLEPCSSKSDFPYYSDTSIGLSYSYDLSIFKRVLRGDVDVKVSLVVDGVEEAIPDSSRVVIDYRRELITLRTISMRWDKNFARPAGFDKKIEIKFSMISGKRVLDSKTIPFAADEIKDQVLVDEPRELVFQSQVDDSSAKVVVELIAAGGLPCRWIQFPGGSYCDPDAKR